MTEAEYLAFERASESKHEYIDGQIFAISGASRAHNLITVSVVAALYNQLRGKSCQVYAGDMRVKISPNRYTYSDLSLVCGEVKFADAEFDALLNPTLIIEVLSPSTEAYDRGKKFQYYRALASLQEYVLIAQDSPQIEPYVRQSENQGVDQANDIWQFSDAIGLEASLNLPSIGCTLALAQIYEQINFAKDAEDMEKP